MEKMQKKNELIFVYGTDSVLIVKIMECVHWMELRELTNFIKA